jgi:hypothetical protein
LSLPIEPDLRLRVKLPKFVFRSGVEVLDSRSDGVRRHVNGETHDSDPLVDQGSAIRLDVLAKAT